MSDRSKQPDKSKKPDKGSIEWNGRIYQVPRDMEAFKANALITAGQARRVR